MNVFDLLISRRVAALVIVMVTALAVWAWPSLRIDNDVSNLLPKDDDVTELIRALEGETGFARSMMVVIEGGELESIIPKLAERLGESPHLEAVIATRGQLFGDSGDALAKAPLYYAPDPVRERLIAALTTERNTRLLARLEELGADDFEFAGDPLGLKALMESSLINSLDIDLAPHTPYLIRADKRQALIVVRGKGSPYDSAVTSVLLDDVRARLGDAPAKLIGSYALMAAQEEQIRKDIVTSVGVSGALVLLFLLASFRRPLDVLVVFVPVVVAVGWTMPIGSRLFGPITPLTMSAAAILLGLGIDFSIHLFTRYNQERTGVSDHARAFEKTMRAVGWPMLAAGLTSAVAFLSFALARFDGLRIFGKLLALGLTLSLIACTFVLGLLLPARAARGGTTVPWLYARMNFGAQRAWLALLPVTLGLGGACVALVLGVSVSMSTERMRAGDDPRLVAEQKLEDQAGFAFEPLFLLLEPGRELGPVQAGVRRLLDEGRLRTVNAAELTIDPAQRAQVVSEARERLAGWEEGFVADLTAAGLDANDFRGVRRRLTKRLASEPAGGPVGAPITVGGRSYRWVAAILPERIATPEQWRAMEQDLNSAFASEPVTVFHTQRLWNRVESLILSDLFRTGALTTLLALLLSVLFTRSVADGALAMLPALLGLGATLGAMSVLNIPFDLGNCPALPFLIGLGVDAGIHLVVHFRRQGSSELGATGLAVWRTGITTQLAFGSLVFASTPAIASLGVLMITGGLVSLLASLVLLPRLWSRLNPPVGVAA